MIDVEREAALRLGRYDLIHSVLELSPQLNSASARGQQVNKHDCHSGRHLPAELIESDAIATICIADKNRLLDDSLKRTTPVDRQLRHVDIQRGEVVYR